MTVTEIASETEIAPTTAWYNLNALEKERIVACISKDNQSGVGRPNKLWFLREMFMGETLEIPI